MMKKLALFGCIVLLSAFSLPQTALQAQDMTIGFVDPHAVLQRMPEMRAVEQRYQNFADSKYQEYAQKEQELQQAFESFQQRLGVISEEARQREEDRIGELQVELQEFEQQATQEIQQRRNELMAPILNQIQSAIDQVAAERGLDYVLNTRTSDADVIILYVNPEIQEEYDITEEVLSVLDV
ncbi:MAG: OmpH family outer membrane protein [Balneolaceae bacterium]